MNIEIPGKNTLDIKSVVFDFNGTLATDGKLNKEVKEKLIKIRQKGLNIYILTADTYGTTKEQCNGLDLTVHVFSKGNGSISKLEFVKSIGGEETIAVGNGNNDIEMFKESALAIAVIGKEGCSVKALFEADIVVTDIIDAIDIILSKDRIKATLRL